MADDDDRGVVVNLRVMPRPQDEPEAKPEPVPIVVDILRDLLERAERGEIRDLAVAMVKTGGAPATRYTEGGDRVGLAAAVAMLHWRYIGSVYDAAEADP